MVQNHWIWNRPSSDIFYLHGSDESVLEDDDNGLEDGHEQEAKIFENVQMLDNNQAISEEVSLG